MQGSLGPTSSFSFTVLLPIAVLIAGPYPLPTNTALGLSPPYPRSSATITPYRHDLLAVPSLTPRRVGSPSLAHNPPWLSILATQHLPGSPWLAPFRLPLATRPRGLAPCVPDPRSLSGRAQPASGAWRIPHALHRPLPVPALRTHSTPSALVSLPIPTSVRSTNGHPGSIFTKIASPRQSPSRTLDHPPRWPRLILGLPHHPPQDTIPHRLHFHPARVVNSPSHLTRPPAPP